MGINPAAKESGLKRSRLYLVDGNSFCYRAYYALGHLSSSSGQPTNAVYGFVTMLNKLMGTEKPDYLAVCFDSKEPTFRHRKFEEYKIHRPGMPDELVSQLPLIREVIGGFNIPMFELAGFEADDLIATIASRAVEADFEVFIATGDKDMLQLVNPKIKIYNTQKQGLIYDTKMVEERYGVPPGKVVDVMALMGDSSDNIPGVPGIGEKTAVRLIQEFGSLEGVLANIDQIKDRYARTLSEYAEQARMSKDLATVDTGVPLEIDLQQLKVGPPDNQRLRRLFERLEFRTLFRLIEDGSSTSANRKKLKSRRGDYRRIRGEAEWKRLVNKLSRLDEFSFHVSGSSRDPVAAEISGVSFCWKPGEASYCVIEDGKGDEQLLSLKKLFGNKNIGKLGHNLKNELIMLARKGIELKGVNFDAAIASYLLNPQKSNHGLAEIAREYLHYQVDGRSASPDSRGQPAGEEEFLDSCRVSDLAWELKEKLSPLLEEKNLSRLFQEVEIPLIEVLVEMETTGVAVDGDFLLGLSREMEKSLGLLTSRIYQLAGEEFNVNSPKQLSSILFEKLDLPRVKRTKTGSSTDVEVLTRLSRLHPLPGVVLEYRELAKLKSGYVDALPRMINARTGRVHTTFNQTVTATGRLSSSEPNLQNIPIKKEEGRKVREAFVAGKQGTCLLSADYSQIELRILAHLSEDETLVRAFRKGVDIHRYTASLVFGVDQAGVTKEMRSVAKTVNFGIVYGMSAYGLARELEIKPEDAKRFISAYFERYPGVRSFLDRQIERAREQGYISTLFSRRRYIPEIGSNNQVRRQFGERVAVNAPIQGSAADLIKVAMIRIHRELKRRRLSAALILQVHDELVFEVPDSEIDEVTALVKEKMEKVVKLKVPLEVEIKTGKNWREI